MDVNFAKGQLNPDDLKLNSNSEAEHKLKTNNKIESAYDVLKTKQNEFYQDPLDPLFETKNDQINLINSNMTSPSKKIPTIDNQFLPAVNRKDINFNESRITALEELNIEENLKFLNKALESRVSIEESKKI